MSRTTYALYTNFMWEGYRKQGIKSNWPYMETYVYAHFVINVEQQMFMWVKFYNAGGPHAENEKFTIDDQKHAA